MFTNIKDSLTIVIPSKNEGRTLYDCVYNISKQNFIAGTKIIIADISDDEQSINFIKRLQLDFSLSLDIKVIKGGYPAKGRYEGGKLVKTPYVLFLDADVFLTDKNVLMETLSKTKHLTSVTF